MISVVICHRNKEFLALLEQNIKQTIGLPYELIIIDNSQNKYSIFQAYNLGVAQSKFDIICFTHEDILIHTKNWGQILINHFVDESIGLVGVIGATIFPKSPSPWWSNTLLNDHLVNNIQHWQNGLSKTNYHTIISKTEKEIVTKDYINPFDKNVIDAAVVDGLWFCIRKKLFEDGKISFDEKTFNGFHCYDSDISLQVNQVSRVVVVYDILVEHFQQGSINKSWFESCIKLNTKWRDKLPLFKKQVDETNYWPYEWNVLLTFVYWMQAQKYSHSEIRKVIKNSIKGYHYTNSSKKIATSLKTYSKYGFFIFRLYNFLNKK